MHILINSKTTPLLCVIALIGGAIGHSGAVNANNNLNSSYVSGSHAMQASQNTSMWFAPDQTQNNTRELISALTDATAHGLNPESYDVSSLQNQIEQFVTLREHSDSLLSDSLQQQRLALEKQLNKAFTRLLSDLGSGVLDATATQRNLYRSAPKLDVTAMLDDVRNRQKSVKNALADVTQTHTVYVGLVAKMRELLSERSSGDLRYQVQHIKGLKPGTDDNSLITLKQRLIQTGDLDDSTAIDSYFDESLEAALKLVQARHGIEETGLVTEDTVIALNKTIDQDIEQVALNLERWRWMPRDLGERHVLVNIPSYNLQMMNDDQKIADMAVVVGSKKHQTPVFSQDVKFVEVAPTWTVPASITNNELIPLELKKPGYLEREKIDFFKWNNGKLKPVPRASVTAADFQKKPFPYVLRQRSGKDNVLGRVKILMPNKYAIYMHDTQAKSLFAKTDRAYSHGCIRLSDPQRLASLILQLDGKDQGQAQSLLAKKKTTRVRINTETQTHLTYYTAWVGEDGKLNTRKDVYRHNKNVKSGLLASNTILSVLDKSLPIYISEQSEL